MRGQGSGIISAKLFFKDSQVTFMPYRVVLKDERRNILKDERPTSNIERRTSNNDVAPLRQFIVYKNRQNTLFKIRC